MNLFENLQLMKENSDVAKLGKKIKQYKGWKIYKGIDDCGNEIFRLFTPDEYRPEIGYEDLETETLDQAISWIDNYNLNESYDYVDSNENDDYYDDLYLNKNDDVVSKYTNIYNSEKKDLEETSANNKYSFTGPVYRFEHIVDVIKEPIYTIAPSIDKAYTNFCYRLKTSLGLERFAKLTINKENIKIVEDEEDFNENDFEDIKQNSGAVINDPKYNVEDPDREDEYVVESIQSYSDWFDENYYELQNEFMNEYNITDDHFDEETINSFIEYANDKYEEYYRNYNWRDEA